MRGTYFGNALRRQRVTITHSDEDDRSYSVECAVEPGTPGRFSFLPELCSPAESAEVEILSVEADDGGDASEERERIEDSPSLRARIADEACEAVAAAGREWAEARADNERDAERDGGVL
jgi:hypothetical protein